MIDTHAHLNFPGLIEQVDKVVVESKKAGLGGIIIASSDVSSSEKAVSLAQQYPDFLWASIGIHPQKTDPKNKASIQEQISFLENLIKKSPKGKIVAIGECGLDFSEPPPHEEERSKKEQEKLFLGQINLAIKYDLPLAVHVRQAQDEALDFIRAYVKNNPQAVKKLRGVFHCYSGGRKRIKQILDLPGKWYFGFDGNLTYEIGLQNIIAEIPKDRLLLETDAPFLSPAPYRDQKNTPAYLPLIAQKVADIWQVSLKEIAKQTTENAQQLFSLKIS